MIWAAVWRWFYLCRDCGKRGCPVMRYADEEYEHRGWCYK